MDWKTVEVCDEDGNGFVFIEKDGLIMPSMFQSIGPDARLAQIKELPYSKDDVLICSYPKTGTHWVSNLVDFLTAGGSVEEKVSVPPKLLELTPPDMFGKVAKSSWRATHLKPDRVPSELLKNGGKVIMVNRNPKDSCVSLMHHLPKMKSELKCGDKVAWKRFFEGWINGETPFGTYFDYYNAWQKEIETNKKLDVLIVQFERLKTDGLKELKKIQEFLGLNHSEERLQEIYDRCSLKNMKADVESGRSFTNLLDENGKSILYRKGEVGDWKNYFTVAQSEYLDKLVEEKFKNSIFKNW